MSYFPFEEYISSVDEEEYNKDLNMRNSIVKYINAILLEPDKSVVSLKKFLNVCLFFKNTFCKESFLYYYLNRFDEEERKVLNLVVFEIFIQSEDGYIGEHKKFYELAFEIYSEMEIDTPIKDSWEYIKAEKI